MNQRNLARWEINTCHATGHLARDLAFVRICKPVSFEIQLCLHTGKLIYPVLELETEAKRFWLHLNMFKV